MIHIKGSDHTIVPPDAAIPVKASSSGEARRGAEDYEVTAADLFPGRISDVFSDPAHGPVK